jgi:hypothetical protein
MIVKIYVYASRNLWPFINSINLFYRIYVKSIRLLSPDTKSFLIL